MLQEATYELTAQAFNGQPSKDDGRLRVQFSLFPHLNEEKSSKEGRPIYDEREYIMIMVPGERDIVHRPVWNRDLERFPHQYQAFKNKQNQDAVSGTPLKVVPWLTLSQVKELEYFNCYTVEQLANMPDSTASKFMALQKYKQLAKDFLQAAKEAAPLTAMRAELEQRDNQLAAQQAQIVELAKQLEAMKKEKESKK